MDSGTSYYCRFSIWLDRENSSYNQNPDMLVYNVYSIIIWHACMIIFFFRWAVNSSKTCQTNIIYYWNIKAVYFQIQQPPYRSIWRNPLQAINWQNIVDLEGILCVDLSTRVGVTADAALLNKAVRALQMKQRAQEEIEIVKEKDLPTSTLQSIHFFLLIWKES